MFSRLDEGLPLQTPHTVTRLVTVSLYEAEDVRGLDEGPSPQTSLATTWKKASLLWIQSQ